MMKKSTLIVILIILGVFTALIAIPGFMKAVNPVFKGSAGYFYKSDLDTRCERDLRWEDAKLSGYACERGYYDGTPETDYDRLKFYRFESTFYAKKAMKAIQKEDRFIKDSVKADKSSCFGIVEGTLDAVVYNYYFRSGNLIIFTSLVLPDRMARDEVYDYNRELRDFDRLIHWIPQEFANPLER